MDAGTKKVLMVLGIGCGTLMILGAIGLGILGYFGFRTAQQIKEDFEHPEKKAQTILGSEQLPPGYYANIAFSIPAIMDVAILSDEQPNPDSKDRRMGTSGFVYFKFKINVGQNRAELDDFFSGKTSDAKILRENNIKIDIDQILDRGTFESNGQTFSYLVNRGEINLDRGRAKGLSTMLLIDCPQDKKIRMGILYQPDPDPAATTDQMELSQTVGDLDKLKNFLGYLHFCK